MAIFMLKLYCFEDLELKLLNHIEKVKVLYDTLRVSLKNTCKEVRK